MLIMAGVSHTHGASHSARYLLILFIFILVSFLITIVAFIIDILLFLPHMAFGTYLVLAAAIVIAISAVVAFAMRRTIVSRKARKQKIAQNAEMSGENYYTREGSNKPAASTFSSVPAPPIMSGATSGGDGLPAFASYESSRPKDDQVSDERIPLTQVRTADRSPVANTSDLANSRSASRDRYGNQTGQQDPYGAQGQGYGPNGRPRGAMAGYRGGGAPRGGRGGYGGGYGPPGAPMRGRGGYGRGGMGPRGRGGPYGQPGQPRDGYGGAAMAGAAGGAMAGAAMAHGRAGYDRDPSAPESYASYNSQPANGRGYNSQQANGQGYDGSWGSRSNPGYVDTESDLPRAESPPPLPTTGSGSAGYGEAVEIGGNEVDHHGYGAPPISTTRENEADPSGMVPMRSGHPAGQIRPGYVSDGSKYSTDEYVAPRAAWNQGSGRRSPRGQSPVHAASGRAMAVESRGPTSPLAGGGYYEDVEPRYETSGPHPALLASPTETPYEDVHAMDGSRSPAGSERSNFTSVSQRGINPRWNPQQHPMPGQPGGGGSARRAVMQQQRQDMILDNPDFQLAGGRGKPKHGNPAGLVPGSAYPNAPM